MFTIQDIAQMVLTEFKTLKRWNEYLVIDIDSEIEDNINYARNLAKTFDWKYPTDQQEKAYRAFTRKHYANIRGVYLPAMTIDAIQAWVNQHRLKERYGSTIATVIATRRLDLADRIIYFVDNQVADIWKIYSDEFLKDKDVFTYLRRGIRLLMGHERRHWIQYRLHYGEEQEVILHCNDSKASLQVAKEDDANWWAWQFNNYHFGDQVANI